MLQDSFPNRSVKNSPLFGIEHFLSAVKDSSTRSRQLLIISIFSSLLILMAWVNSLAPEINWYRSRTDVRKSILTHFIFPTTSVDTTFYYAGLKKIYIPPVDSLSKYIEINEELINKNKLTAYQKSAIKELLKNHILRGGIMLKHPRLAPTYGDSFQERLKKYGYIKRAATYIYTHSINDDRLLINFINKLDEAEIEHIDLVRVPILGISFDINYLGTYSGLTLVVMYALLLLSLNREHTNLEILFRRAWDETIHHHFHFYEYVSMLQVLSFPRKLFEPHMNRERYYPMLSICALAFPWMIYLIVVLYDVKTFNVGDEINSLMTYSTLVISLVSFILLSILTGRIVNRWIIMDDLWETQALEFNFEYILESLDEDKDKDFGTVLGSKIEPEHLDKVKYMWYLAVEKIIRKDKTQDEQYCAKAFRKFINNVLKTDYNGKYLKAGIKENEKIDVYWNYLKNWFNENGKKSFPSKFKSSFLKTIQDCVGVT
jgi:hypothetical protein